MKKYSIASIVILVAAIAGCNEQISLQQRFQNHIAYLASDQLEGREAGSQGETLASEYIVKEFKSIGLSPGNSGSYIQEFDFLLTKNVDKSILTLDGVEISKEDDYFYPLNYSSSSSAAGNLLDVGFGISAADLNYDDYQSKDVTDKIAIINVSSPDGIHPHSKYLEYHGLRDRAKTAQSLGAVAVIFVNNDPTAADPESNYMDKVTAMDIPVIFSSEFEKVINSSMASVEVEIVEKNAVGRNLVGYLDNGTDQTVIFGAHYDHLGYGTLGGSLYRGEPEIHNGADDNASGTSMLIELARGLKNSTLTNSNYLFLAFSAEEKGLLGANFFTKNPTIDLSTANYMINMDMVGRLDTADYDIAINGVGTSPRWESLLTQLESAPSPLNITTSESGVGPSDHTSFYLKDIPVLHFFTGTHGDYHKPTDDVELINFAGMEQVYKFIYSITEVLNEEEKLAFSKTDDSSGRMAPRFTVTMGVVPDYMYEDEGLKIDGVNEGKPAFEAGIQRGDIIVRIGEWEVEDIYAYMEVLSKLQKGTKTDVEVLREGESLVLGIEF